jgi:glycosyltransferase involved in cell wall biosynthesis
MNGNCLLISKRIFESVGLFDESLRTTQDYDLFFRMLSRHRVLFQPDTLVTARVHPQQDTVAKNDLNVRESDELWTGFINKCRDIDVEGYEASWVEFWIKFANHLYQSPYPTARCRVSEEVIKALNDHRLSQVPLVSVVIPFVEVDNLLARAVKFAMMQTYGNLEILLCANRQVAEADFEQIRYLSSIYKRPIRIVEAWSKKGASHARNRGMDEATGELIALLDADDLWHPLKIEQQVKVIDAMPGINVVATAYVPNHWQFESFVDQRKMILNCDDYLYELVNIYATPSFLFRKTTHRFDESMSICEDIDFFGSLIVGGQFICLPTRSTVVTIKSEYQWRLSDAYNARKGVWLKFSGEHYSKPHDHALFGVMVGAALRRRTIDDLVFLIQNLQRVKTYVSIKEFDVQLLQEIADKGRQMESRIRQGRLERDDLSLQLKTLEHLLATANASLAGEQVRELDLAQSEREHALSH